MHRQQGNTADKTMIILETLLLKMEGNYNGRITTKGDYLSGADRYN